MNSKLCYFSRLTLDFGHLMTEFALNRVPRGFESEQHAAYVAEVGTRLEWLQDAYAIYHLINVINV